VKTRLFFLPASNGESIARTLRALNPRTDEKHPTSNNQHRTSNDLRLEVLWMLGVRCWMFDVPEGSWKEIKGEVSLSKSAFELFTGAYQKMSTLPLGHINTLL
jgi:hypothetical protein